MLARVKCHEAERTLHCDRVFKVTEAQATPLFGNSNAQKTHITKFRKDILLLVSPTFTLDAQRTLGIVLVLSISTARGAISFSAKLETACLNYCRDGISLKLGITVKLTSSCSGVRPATAALYEVYDRTSTARRLAPPTPRLADVLTSDPIMLDSAAEYPVFSLDCNKPVVKKRALNILRDLGGPLPRGGRILDAGQSVANRSTASTWHTTVAYHPVVLSCSACSIAPTYSCRSRSSPRPPSPANKSS